jgi:hypothetical protein
LPASIEATASEPTLRGAAPPLESWLAGICAMADMSDRAAFFASM